MIIYNFDVHALVYLFSYIVKRVVNI